jgi:hypothetical protein
MGSCGLHQNGTSTRQSAGRVDLNSFGDGIGKSIQELGRHFGRSEGRNEGGLSRIWKSWQSLIQEACTCSVSCFDYTSSPILKVLTLLLFSPLLDQPTHHGSL